ncbi:hypothetical protein [Cryptosporangium arvum]|uniref:Uncharacterized protein n=1 Tax=Cryptosporangium arvum DSM 44712 TaxID=927661 RepID=A0A010YNZ3_9ACTN|nr:hypothetical protein [Cryptosporangium arvum]EXG81895.1 hypothetical protein CryarDRAFT_3016 [Cryptosporangium arvum DSM 44712]
MSVPSSRCGRRPNTAPADAALSVASFVVFALTADVDDTQHRIAVADAVLPVLLGTATALPDRRVAP